MRRRCISCGRPGPTITCRRCRERLAIIGLLRWLIPQGRP